MIAKQILLLANLPDSELFAEVSVGMQAALKNALALSHDASFLLKSERKRAADILFSIAEEEAAKVQILLDVVRCPKSGPAFAVQLKRFNDHLAKGIYAKYSSTRPADIDEVARFVGDERDEYYLDGPEDIDWVFRNQILQGREELFYVDYVATDDGCRWLEPMYEYGRMRLLLEPAAVNLAALFVRAGMDNPKSLELIADKWRGVSFPAGTHWQVCAQQNRETVVALHERSLLTEFGQKNVSRIIDEWLFPLWPLDLKTRRVEPGDLR